MKNYRIGCSGYFYKQWKGGFYPSDLPESQWLKYYCEHFNSTEITSTFYKFPDLHNLSRWRNKTPTDFMFSIKVPQFLTHVTKLTNPDLINKFYHIAERALKEKLKCVVFQMSPDLPYSPRFLEHIINNLNYDFTNVIEFRHNSWWNEEVYSAFKSKNIVFGSISYPGLPEDFIATSSTIYLKLHGIEELYHSTYSLLEIDSWYKKIKSQKFKDFFIYFNNTWEMGAVYNAFEMKMALMAKPDFNGKSFERVYTSR